MSRVNLMRAVLVGVALLLSLWDASFWKAAVIYGFSVIFCLEFQHRIAGPLIETARSDRQSKLLLTAVWVLSASLVINGAIGKLTELPGTEGNQHWGPGVVLFVGLLLIVSMIMSHLERWVHRSPTQAIQA